MGRHCRLFQRVGGQETQHEVRDVLQHSPFLVLEPPLRGPSRNPWAGPPPVAVRHAHDGPVDSLDEQVYSYSKAGVRCYLQVMPSGHPVLTGTSRPSS